MVQVKRQKGESVEHLINRFRQEVTKSGKIDKIREISRYEKDSQKRKKQKYRKKHNIELEKKRKSA